MIKNIVFDMGQVLLDFNPEEFLNRVGVKDNNDRQLLKEEIYQSIEWAKMDRGLLTEEQATKIIEQRVPERLRQYVEDLVCNWSDSIIPIAGAKQLIQELKENGYKIYLLSNTSYKFNEFFKRVPGSEYFDGEVVSCDVKMIKPELGIYNHLLDKYSLKADETVFIDNSCSNVEAATCLGINGIVFHGDYAKVREKLLELGVKVEK